MFDKAEQEFKDLSEKKRIVENDKHKIHKVCRCSASKPHDALRMSSPRLGMCAPNCARAGPHAAYLHTSRECQR